MKRLSVGKTRHLQQLTNRNGIFTMVAIDHREPMIESIQARQNGVLPSDEIISRQKQTLSQALAPHTSALLVDPIYSVDSLIRWGALPGDVGLMVAREKSGYVESEQGRTTELLPSWNAARIKQVGAAGVKLLLHYHPEAPNAAQQEDVVRQVAEECRAADIPFLLEPLCYPLQAEQAKSEADFAAQRPQLVLESARRLAPLGVDLLKMEFPTDARHEHDPAVMRRYCRELSAAIDIPWVLLSAGVGFDTFQKQVEYACEAGASGFVAGRTIWREAVETEDIKERAYYLERIAVSRTKILANIASYRGTSWTTRLRLK